ncbi:SdpI family protein [Alkalicoccobacillus porphyridii]|nr:SdpI family protein [Alkalicoccobacillus porphyridii]
MSRKWLCRSIMLTTFLISFWFYLYLPNTVTIPFIGSVSTWAWLFFLPVTLSVLCLLRQSRLFVVITTLLALLQWVLLYLSIFVGLDVDTTIFLFVSYVIGFLYILLGYLSSRVKQNPILGLRVSWTLHNEEVWRRANRFSGTGMVYIGLMTMAASLIVTMLYRSSAYAEMVFFGSIVLLVVFIVVSLIYAYRVHREVTVEGK